MIDLRSDTVSLPTPEMRDAMAHAVVGDDVYGADPSVNALEKRTAEILGKEDAIYMPTGTMSNQVALRTHTEAGDAVLMDAKAHLFLMEGGAPAALSGVLVRPLNGINGIFTADDVDQAVGTSHPFNPTTLSPPPRLVCVENTHNGAGGVIWPYEKIVEVTETAKNHGLATHLDGARIWNASAATGIPEKDYASHFDSVSVCFSKGLGAPMGSALVGSRQFTDRARRFKQMFGGGFRQAGIVAAGALFALDNHRPRLAEDHANAGAFASGLNKNPGIQIDPSLVQTNIIRFRVISLSASEFVTRCFEGGLYMLPTSRDQLRAVTHIGITDQDIEKGLEIVNSVLQ